MECKNCGDEIGDERNVHRETWETKTEPGKGLCIDCLIQSQLEVENERRLRHSVEQGLQVHVLNQVGWDGDVDYPD